MRELVITSGKGGTGKTSLTAALAHLADNKVLCDADVDAADLHLILNPVIQKRTAFQGGNIAKINLDQCSQCFICKQLCRFDAIDSQLRINLIECEGCGVCVKFCPEQAIDFSVRICGEWYVSESDTGPMVHARLGIAEESSGRLVALVRQEAKKIAEANRLNLIITDGPPGVGCPAISSITGANALLIVTEPTVSGLHDLKRLYKLALNFRLPCKICINKYDINLEQTELIEQFAKLNDIEIIAKIPFDSIFIEAMLQKKSIFEFKPDSPICNIIINIWDKIIRMPEMNVFNPIPAIHNNNINKGDYLL
jgi:MinD superfamily P-loop ATPase